MDDTPHAPGQVWSRAALQALLEARAAGLTLHALGARHGGLTRERIRQLLQIATRRHGLQPRGEFAQ